MEKLLRRTILNRNQLLNKKRRESAKDVRKTWRDYNRMKNLQATEINRIIKSERLARREDWMLGPLAPKRDAGAQKDTYGAVENLLAQAPELPKREWRGPKGSGADALGMEDKRMPGFEDGEWRGEGLPGNLVVGDRVVVVKGRVGLKGKIGEVVRVDEKADRVFIKGVNKVDMIIPAQALTSANSQRIFEQELPVPFSDLKLVTQQPDPVTGILKDVIVRQVYGGAPYQERAHGSNLPRHTRYIKTTTTTTNPTNPRIDTEFVEPEENAVIPWPKEDIERHFTQNVDTTADLVDKVTYTPGFLEGVPVMPSAVDELRGKHSRQRRDWDDLEFMQRKMLEDARRDWFKERSRVLSEPFWTKEFLMREKKQIEQRTRRVIEEEL